MCGGAGRLGGARAGVSPVSNLLFAALRWLHFAGLGILGWLTLLHEDESSYTSAGGWSVAFREFQKTDYFLVVAVAVVSCFFLARSGMRRAVESHRPLHRGDFAAWFVLDGGLVFLILAYLALE